MPAKQLIATRQELLKVRAKTKSAQKGKSLLKDKRDSLMKQLYEQMNRAMELRKTFDAAYLEAFELFQQAKSHIDPHYLAGLTQSATMNVGLVSTNTTSMGVTIPRLESTIQGSPTQYSVSTTPAQLDTSVLALPTLVQLLEAEYAALLLAREIEKTRRRVNALDYVLIPELQKNLKTIQSKLEEQARDVTVSLMKVKAKMKAA